MKFDAVAGRVGDVMESHGSHPAIVARSFTAGGRRAGPAGSRDGGRSESVAVAAERRQAVSYVPPA